MEQNFNTTLGNRVLVQTNQSGFQLYNSFRITIQRASFKINGNSSSTIDIIINIMFRLQNIFNRIVQLVLRLILYQLRVIRQI